MATTFDAREAKAGLDRVAQALARLEGRKDALLAREAELTRTVGLAKGRVALKGEVQAFLDQIQEEHSRRNVESFEKLLSALADEVIPGIDPIRLDLSTERGLPALDITVQRPGGEKSDVYEDQGGALTNVVGAGLRLVAVVKSNLRRFVVLDEADCWIKPDRVPVFYKVMEDAANRLGIQCLAISHHDVSTFESNIRVAEIQGRPETGVKLSNPVPEPEWLPEQPGFRYIRLVDVQAYEDAVIVLSPGVNAITGPNNHGKSTFARALRAVFFGEARDSLVRFGAQRAMVEIGLENGRLLRFVRQPRKTPVNSWSLHEADGSVVVEDGVRHDTIRGMPPWVQDRLGIRPIEDLDAHIGRQKKPVFLLDDPASKRASVLSVGQESDHVRRMIVIHKEMNTRDAATIREGEREIGAGRDRLAKLARSEPLTERLEELRQGLADIETRQRRLDDAERRLDALERSRGALERTRGRAAALEALPGEPVLDALRATLRDGIAREELADRIDGIGADWRKAYALAGALDSLPEREAVLPKDTDRMLALGLAIHRPKTALAKGRSILETLAGLPIAAPELRATRPMEEWLDRIEQSARRAEASRTSLGDVKARLEGVESRLAELHASLGGHCPTCGQAVADPHSLLGEHVHP